MTDMDLMSQSLSTASFSDLAPHPRKSTLYGGAMESLARQSWKEELYLSKLKGRTLLSILVGQKGSDANTNASN